MDGVLFRYIIGIFLRRLRCAVSNCGTNGRFIRIWQSDAHGYGIIPSFFIRSVRTCAPCRYLHKILFHRQTAYCWSLAQGRHVRVASTLTIFHRQQIMDRHTANNILLFSAAHSGKGDRPIGLLAVRDSYCRQYGTVENLFRMDVSSESIVLHTQMLFMMSTIERNAPEKTSRSARDP